MGHRRIATPLAVVVSLALGLTACGETGEPVGPTPGASSSAEGAAPSGGTERGTPAVDGPTAEHGDIILGVAESFGMGRTFEPPPGPLDRRYTETSEPDQEAIEELRRTKLAMAAADFECTRSTELHSVALDIRDTAEQDFIEHHRAELDELTAAFSEHEATKND